jgi:hypothetical protein
MKRKKDCKLGSENKCRDLMRQMSRMRVIVVVVVVVVDG